MLSCRRTEIAAIWASIGMHRKQPFFHLQNSSHMPRGNQKGVFLTGMTTPCAEMITSEEIRDEATGAAHCPRNTAAQANPAESAASHSAVPSTGVTATASHAATAGEHLCLWRYFIEQSPITLQDCVPNFQTYSHCKCSVQSHTMMVCSSYSHRHAAYKH